MTGNDDVAGNDDTAGNGGTAGNHDAAGNDDAAGGAADPIGRLASVLAQTAGLIDGVGEEQHGHATPCRSWTVGELLGHLVHDLRQFTVTAEGGRPDWEDPVDRVDADWLHVFEAGAEDLVAAWRENDDLTAEYESGSGATPPRGFLLDQQVAEFAVHGWDLARATGQSTTGLDLDAAQASLAWGKGALRPEFRGTEADGHRFGPEVAVAGDAPVYDRLAAFFGRDPGWR
ncbi:TIGR03086 family metal-binding protein [Kitasatospora sp. NPDC004240]